MTPTRAAAIAAIVASVGLSALTPAIAQENREPRQHRMLEFRAAPHGRFELAQFSCAPKAADRLERRFDRLAERLKLSEQQKPLYEAFMTSALVAQTELSDKCAAMRPTRAAGEGANKGADKGKGQRPDLLQRMEMQLKFDEARLVAVNAAFPDFKAFYASLSDEQKRQLLPAGRATPQPHPARPRP